MSDVSYSNEIENEHFELEDKSWWFIHKGRVAKAVADTFSYGQEFIEVGGGNGAISKYLQDNSYDVTMYEPLVAGANNAKKRGVKKVVNDYFKRSATEIESIHNIGIFDVLEHIESEGTMLSEFRDVLSLNGVLIVSVPAYQSLWAASDNYLGHYRRYNKRTLEEALRKNGFEVKYCTYFFCFLPIAIFLFRHLPYVFSKQETKQTPLKTREFVLPTFVHKFILKLLAFELTAIYKRKSIPFGSSVLAVAVKSNK